MQDNYYRVYIYATIVALGGFVFGFDASVISGVTKAVSIKFDLNLWQEGLVVSSPSIGAFIAAMTIGPLSDAHGRKKILVLVAGLYLVSALISALAPSYIVLVTARFIGGLAFGSLILAPMYISEIAPPHLRGRLISVNQLNIVIGLSAAYFSNFLLSGIAKSEDLWVANLGFTTDLWRWMLGVELIPAACWFCLLFMIPESPRWCVLNGKKHNAKLILEKILPLNRVEEVFDSVVTNIKQAQEPLLKRLVRLFDKRYRYVLLIGVIVGLTQQITGINAVLFYAPRIFEQSGLGIDGSLATAAGVGIVNVIFTIVSMFCIDKIGRKPLMIIGLGGVFICLSMASFGFKQATYTITPKVWTVVEQELKDDISQNIDSQNYIGKTFDNDVDFKNVFHEILEESTYKEKEAELIKNAIHVNVAIVLVGLMGFVAFFALSLGPVMWVLLAEIFPNAIRGVAISAVGVLNSGASFLVQQVFPWELAVLGVSTTFMIYAVFAIIGFVLVLLFLPETKGQSLEEIEANYAS